MTDLSLFAISFLDAASKVRLASARRFFDSSKSCLCWSALYKVNAG